MKKSSTKFRKVNTKITISVIAIILIILLLIIVLELNGINIISGRIRVNRKALNLLSTIAEYEIMGKDNATNELETLVTIENENGIKTIEIENFKIDVNGRKKISFDRKLIENSTTNVKIKLNNEEEENFVLVPTEEPTALMRVTQSKKGEDDWQNKVELSKNDIIAQTYYSLDEGENWILLSEDIVLSNVETDKIKVNKRNDNIWQVKKKNNIKQTGYDTVTELVENIVDESGYYIALVHEEQIAIHAYVENESLSISETTEYGDANDIGTVNTNAKNMVVLKINGDLTINENAKLTSYGTEYGGPKGLYVYVTGKLENNGEISMTARGAKAVGQNVYLYNNNDGTYEYVPKLGAVGAGRTYAASGTDGTGRATGGGGAGGGDKGTPGAGAQGTSYSGGSGGGGVHQGGASAGAANGGAGGEAAGYENSTNVGFKTGGGAGNPGGASHIKRATQGKGEDGTGGLLIIYTNEFLNNGIISSNGSKGGDGLLSYSFWSKRWPVEVVLGGGSINIFYKTNTSTQTSSIIANGGAGGTHESGGTNGGNGGNGTVTLKNIQ